MSSSKSRKKAEAGSVLLAAPETLEGPVEIVPGDSQAPASPDPLPPAEPVTPQSLIDRENANVARAQAALDGPHGPDVDLTGLRTALSNAQSKRDQMLANLDPCGAEARRIKGLPV